jgi:hypothetical protein
LLGIRAVQLLERGQRAPLRCNERLKPKAEGSTRFTYTGLCGGLEHLKIETRLIIADERFGSVWFRIYSHPINIQCDPQCCRFGDNVPNLRFDLWGEHCAEDEPVFRCLWRSRSGIVFLSCMFISNRMKKDESRGYKMSR